MQSPAAVSAAAAAPANGSYVLCLFWGIGHSRTTRRIPLFSFSLLWSLAHILTPFPCPPQAVSQVIPSPSRCLWSMPCKCELWRSRWAARWLSSHLKGQWPRQVLFSSVSSLCHFFPLSISFFLSLPLSSRSARRALTSCG